MITTSHGATKEAKEATMTEAYDWLAEKHGEENIIMASKHRDETTPHIHIVVVPIDEKGKLNARSFIGGTKHRMGDLQDEFYGRLKKANIDINRGLKGSKAKHQTIKQWHAKKKKISKQGNITLEQVKSGLERRKKTVLSKESQKEANERVAKAVVRMVNEHKQTIHDIQTELSLATKYKEGHEKITSLKNDVQLGETRTLNALLLTAEKNKAKIEARKVNREQKRRNKKLSR